MIDRLKNLFKPEEFTHSESGVEDLLQDLDQAIASVSKQYQKISLQEKELITRLSDYKAQHAEKIAEAKLAFRSGDELRAESLFEESELISRQIDQYSGIVRDIRKTSQQLLSQKNQFRFTRDQLRTRQSLGEASLDASQLNADLSEQLLILDETGELSQIDELIRAASSKSQAIEEIRGNDILLEALSDEQETDTLDKVRHLVNEDKNKKLRASQQNQQILIEQVFGKLTPSIDPTIAKNKETLLEKLKNHTDTADGREKKVSGFFDKNEMENPSNDQKDRIKNFFNANDQQGKTRKKSIIDQFFNSKS